ncbi:hypothetical protein GCM10023183_29470 [Nibribacter koreensis]|uniref:Uncharacterized protein n=2 Tax=Nibribacter koreensis TaxID=1084519 RepID=A0ABP8FU67_9BACT
MKEFEFGKISKQLTLQGLLQEKAVKKPYEADKYIALYQFQNINRNGFLDPIFLTDRLDVLRIFIGKHPDIGETQKATIKEYQGVVEYFSEIYGAPSKSTKDSKTEHRSTIWNAGDFDVIVAFIPMYDLTGDQIGIYFEPIGELKVKLEEYNRQKKEEWKKMRFINYRLQH